MKLLLVAVIACVLLVAGRRSAAHGRVIIGGRVPYFAYPYPVYSYSYPGYWYPPPVPGFEYGSIPPPSWAPGRWEWHRDAYGREYRVLIPPHLR